MAEQHDHDLHPPTSWVVDGAVYELRPSEGVHWEVTRHGVPIGHLIYLVDVERWSVRLPDDVTAGVGATWDDWKDAVLALADFHRFP